MALALANFSRPLRLCRNTTIIGASTTSNIIPIAQCLGWKTLHIFCEAVVEGTLNVFQKERGGGTFRLTDAILIPAGPPAVSDEVLVTGEYLRIQCVGGVTAQSRFVLLATLMPL